MFTTDRYTSQEFLEREKQHIFRKTWLVAARESDVPGPGDCLAVDVVDSRIVLVRGDDGLVRAFHNTCRHRGTRLVARRCAAAQITCPYHGWTYALDGRLIGVPGMEGFETFDTGHRGLLAVRSACWGGFVWITFDAEAPPVAVYLGAVATQLEPYRLSDMRPLLRRDWTLPCNWKAVLDQATESYHVRSVHHRSIAQVLHARATFRGFDPHHLQTVPIADYGWRTRLDRLSVPDDLPFTPDQLRLFHKYHVFPNAVMNVMPYHLTVFRVFPLSPDSCRFHYEFYLRAKPGAVARLRGWLTLAASLVILREDLRMLSPFQSGQQAAASRAIAFHREERPLAYFHGVVDRYVGHRGDGADEHERMRGARPPVISVSAAR